jgi:thiamine transport system substrate-binding protein
MNHNRRIVLAAALLVLSAASCQPATPAVGAPVPRTERRRLLRCQQHAHDAFELITTCGSAFSERRQRRRSTNHTRQEPLADVFYGVDNTFLSRQAGIFDAYRPAWRQSRGVQADSQQRTLPVDYGDVCLNYDKACFFTPGAAAVAGGSCQPVSTCSVGDRPSPRPGPAGHCKRMATRDTWTSRRASTRGRRRRVGGLYLQRFPGLGAADRRLVCASRRPKWSLPIRRSTTPPPLSRSGMCFRQIGVRRHLHGRRTTTAGLHRQYSPDFQEDMPLKMFIGGPSASYPGCSPASHRFRRSRPHSRRAVRRS